MTYPPEYTDVILDAAITNKLSPDTIAMVFEVSDCPMTFYAIVSNCITTNNGSILDVLNILHG